MARRWSGGEAISCCSHPLTCGSVAVSGAWSFQTRRHLRVCAGRVDHGVDVGLRPAVPVAAVTAAARPPQATISRVVHVIALPLPPRARGDAGRFSCHRRHGVSTLTAGRDR
jgi:hypothetical protein